MSFDDGFEAIEKVKTSGQKLAEVVARIEQFEARLDALPDAQTKIEEMLDKATRAVASLQETANGMSAQREAFADLAQALPSLVRDVVKGAEDRFEKQHAEISKLANDLPRLVEAVVEEKLTTILGQLEARITERLRDELKDTRTTLREAIEIGIGRGEANLEEARKDIIAEMPRSLFGRRGR
jgi:DNA repair exonuclease SbcCD ATPase subunit